MKSKYYLTFFACLVLITTTIVNVSIYKKNLRVYGQVPTKPGSFCTVNGAFKCEQYLSMAISFKCVNHQWSFYQHCPSNRCNLSNTACESVTLPTPTTVGNTYPPTSTPRPVYPTPTGAGATNPPPPTLGYIPCFEIERVYTQYCRSQPTPTSVSYPTSTPRPTYLITPTVKPRPSAIIIP